MASTFAIASADAITIPRPVQPIEGDIVLMDMRICELTLGTVVSEIIPFFKQQYPEYDIIMDGDQYAIVARPKVVG